MTSRTDKQRELYEKWQNEGDSDALNELINSVDPLLDSKAEEFTPPSVKKETVKNKMKNQLVQDLPDYDPEQSAFTTWAINFPVRKTPRFVNKIQNTAYIPEARTQKISSYKNAKDKLKDKLGQEPSAQQLSDELGWPIKEIELIEKSQRDEIPTSSMESVGNFEAFEFSPADDIMNLIEYDLDEEEAVVFEHLTGRGGKEKLKGKEIADKMDISPAKVSKIKKRIEEKIGRYL